MVTVAPSAKAVQRGQFESLMKPSAKTSKALTIAVDVGNSRIKFGVFERAADDRALPGSLASLALPLSAELDWRKLASHFNDWAPLVTRAVIAGANPGFVERVLSGWPPAVWKQPIAIRRADELPLKVNVEVPDKVGID